MPAPTSLIEGYHLASPAEDFKTARRVEQYRVSGEALYIPAGFRWNYIPFSAIRTAEESHFSVTAGKCVAVTEKRPSLHLDTAGGSFDFPLEKAASLQAVLDAIRKEA